MNVRDVYPALLVFGLALGQLSAAQPAPRVYRDKVRAHWCGDQDHFWYRVQVDHDRHEFILVEPEKALRRAAFDHARLAEALQKAGVKSARAENLPLANLQFEAREAAIVFEAGQRVWRCDLKTYELKPQPHAAVSTAGAALADGPRASRRTGDATTLTFLNQTEGEVKLYWLDSEGQRQSYGLLGPGQSREQHTYAGHVWLVTDGAGKALAVFEADEAAGEAAIKGEVAPQTKAPPAPGLSPDGRWRAFIQGHSLILKNVETAEETRLGSAGTREDGYTGNVYWAPDSQKLVALRTRKGDNRKVYLIESSPKDQLQPELHSYNYPKPGDRIDVSMPHLFEVAGKREILVADALFPEPWAIDEVRWAPDSSRFTFLYNQRGHQVLRVVAVDATRGTTTAVVDEHSATFIDYSGKKFLEYLDGPSPEIIWMSERDGWNHLYLYDALKGTVKNQITKGPWVVRGVDYVDKERRQIWFRAGGIRPGQDPYYIHYCRINFDGSGLVLLTEGDGTHSVQYSPDRRFIVDGWSRVDLAPVHELRRAEDGKLVCRLEASDTHELDAAGWRPPERFTAKGRDRETDIYGIIHWPKGPAPEKRYAVVENIYAGPHGSFVPKGFQVSYPSAPLSARGFVVVQIDGLGTSDRSKKFHDVCWKNLGDAGFPDRILWLKAAGAKYPCLDLTRLGIYGTSAGGQSALRALLAHGDFYKAAVADCGCHDNRMDKIWWNEQWMGWPVGPHYEDQSNVTQAHRLQGHLLLMVGEMDRNVDPSSTMQVVNALIKADKDFDLLVVPGAGHGVLGSPYAQRRMGDFFARYLLPAPPSPAPGAVTPRL
jgi:dipeptidyl-peptidase 4